MKDLDFENSIGVIIKRASQVLEKSLEEKLKQECDLSGGKWKVIIALTVKDGLNQKDIADMIFVESPTLVSIIDRMEKSGLVERRRDPDDRRNNRIFLSKKSKDMVDTIVDCVLDLRQTISKSITKKEMAVTKDVLRRITASANEYYDRLISEKST